MMSTWDELPSKGQLKERIDAFLRAFHAADFDEAFRQCPPLVYEKDKGMILRPGLAAAERAQHLSHAMFQAIDGQSAIEGKASGAVATKPETWCMFITPPKEVDYADLSLQFPGGDDDDDGPDDARAEEEGEVLANVHLEGEVTDITGRYSLMQHDGKWILAFENFDVM